MASTTGMRGGGFYDAHSAGQRAAMDAFLPWIVDAVAEMPLPVDGSPITLLDLGSSEGANAIHAIGTIVRALRQRTQAEIWTFFDDLPTNDFNRLFTNLAALQASSEHPGGIYAAAIGGSLFERVVPAASLHVATTFNAVGWLSSLPAQRASLVEQARLDMQNFYRARAAELRPGGKLLVQVFGRNEQYDTGTGILDGLSDAMLDLVNAGRLPGHVHERFLFPVTYRSLQELLPQPAENHTSGAFRVDQAEARECPVPFNEEFARSGDARVWAERFAGFIRAFSEPVVAAGLPDGPDRPRLVQELYQRMEDRFAAEPDRYEFHFISLAALLTRL